MDRERRVASSDKSVSLIAPKGWVVDSKPLRQGAKLSLTSPAEREAERPSVLLFIKEDKLLSHPLEYYIQNAMSSGKTILEDSSVQMSDHIARRLVVSWTIKGEPIKSLIHFVEKGGSVYCITALMPTSGYETWRDELEEIFRSFQLL